MPNHYHLPVRQEKENAISKFMSQVQNSDTKYSILREKNKKDYQEFIFNQADYQRKLEKIKHLTWEN